jgi:hypothetical protein
MNEMKYFVLKGVMKRAKKRAGLLRTGSVTTLTSLITYFLINSYQTASSKVQKHYMQGHVISY